MKPADLKPPFQKEQRKVTIHDYIWYTPAPYATDPIFEFPGWDHPLLFGNTKPVFLEYCSGNGAWIAAQALANPHINWVAVEKKFMRVKKIWSKLKNFGLNNLIVVCGEGFNATKTYFPSHTIGKVFINFPDPWPKSRHAKHRLIHSSFVEELARVVVSGGVVTFVTDDKSYSEEVIKLFLAHLQFESYYKDPYFSLNLNNYGNSYFEDLWRSKGKEIRYHQFIKKHL